MLRIAILIYANQQFEKKKMSDLFRNSSDWLYKGVQRRRWEDFLVKIKKKSVPLKEGSSYTKSYVKPTRISQFMTGPNICKVKQPAAKRG